MAAAERLPLLKKAERDVVSTHNRGYVRIFLCCVALAVVAATTAGLFPRGVAGRPSQETQLSGSVVTGVITDEEDGSTLAPGAYRGGNVLLLSCSLP